MAEYIEREAVIKVLHENTTEMESDIYYGSNKGVPKGEIEDIINEIPAADVAEVRHGEWEEVNYFAGCLNPYQHTCGCCGKSYFDNNSTSYPFCPNCGADMRGKKDE